MNEINYIPIEENKDKKYKKDCWEIAFGLQKVDNLTPSEYMINLAKDNIEGHKNYNEVENELNTYYQSQPLDSVNFNEKEADEVSLRIVKLLNDKSFTFGYMTYKQYHRELFYGVDLGISGKYIGEFRDYNITKEEPVLNGNTVTYADFRMIVETLKYDFDEEANQKYTQMTKEEQVKRIATFTSRIWQVHPFCEGNTRTTAVFIQKYLNSKGFNVNNDLFKEHSLYFRNALVRANYSNIQQGIESDDSHLIALFENLLLDKNNELNNDRLYVSSNKRSITENKADDFGENNY